MIIKSQAQELRGFENNQPAGLNNKYYQNPILAGGDPSLLRVGDDYYMTQCSFVYYPGFLIWHSKDLVNWEPLCRALHKFLGYVTAPEFIKFDDQYYIYWASAGTNWVITAPRPEGPWSDPIDLKIGKLIDPGHVVAQDGTRYLHLAGGFIIQLSHDGLSTTGKLTRCYEGWPIPTDWAVECNTCLEGPKLTYKDGYYYLTSAEGGTAGPATAHMVISARSKTPLGPWENSPYNPIVHTWNKGEKWHAKGHGTLIEDTEKNWWIVYHSYEKGFYTLGKQTLMEPIEWTHDGWFKVPSSIRTDLPIKKPAGAKVPHGMTLSDDFSGPGLGIQWTFFNEYNPDRYKIDNGKLILNPQGTSPTDCAPLLCNPPDHSYEAQVEYQLTTGAIGGLVVFFNPQAYGGIATDGQSYISYRRAQASKQGINQVNHGFLKIVNIENTVSFYYSPDGTNWDKIKGSIVTDSYEKNAFGPSLSLQIGLVSMGKGSVIFDNFIYKKL
ncbi:MAG: family 43 glycosylhydrolase [Prolixibacteraceae bacterium]